MTGIIYQGVKDILTENSSSDRISGQDIGTWCTSICSGFAFDSYTGFAICIKTQIELMTVHDLILYKTINEYNVCTINNALTLRVACGTRVSQFCVRVVSLRYRAAMVVSLCSFRSRRIHRCTNVMVSVRASRRHRRLGIACLGYRFF